MGRKKNSVDATRRPETRAQTIRLKLENSHGGVADFVTSPTGSFSFAFALYPTGTRLTYNGAEIRADQTPEELGMQDGDTLTVVVSQNNLEPANAGLVHPNVFGGQVINLRLADANGNEVDVQTNPTVPLITLTIEWSMAVLTPAPATSIHFTYNGTEVGLDQTPAELGMRDGDTLMVTVD